MPNQEEKRIQWHPGFVTAIDLDMEIHRSGMTQEREYNLNTKPLEIDILLRRPPGRKDGDNDNRNDKDRDNHNNEISRIFRQYNILEYKSPESRLDIDTCYKVNGYACLFKAYGDKVHSISAEDVTISLFRHAKPEKLLAYCAKRGFTVTNPYPGIYYVEHMLFATQIVVTRELDFDRHIWLVALSGRLEKQQVKKILEKAARLTDRHEKELADSVLQVCIAANKTIVKELKEEEQGMCEALREIMEPELRQSREEGREEGRVIGEKRGMERGIEQGIEQSIVITIQSLREVGQQEETIRQIVIKNFKLQPDEADKLMAR